MDTAKLIQLHCKAIAERTEQALGVALREKKHLAVGEYFVTTPQFIGTKLELCLFPWDEDQRQLTPELPPLPNNGKWTIYWTNTLKAPYNG